MHNVISFLTSRSGVATIRELALAHAGGKRPGGKNYRLIKKLIDVGFIFQVGDNLFVKG